MKPLLIVALGGALGACCRYLIGLWIKPIDPTIFPWHTFLVNISGCFIIGIICSYFSYYKGPSAIELFLTTGLLGGFTTFSGFGAETYLLLKNQSFKTAFQYLVGTNLMGLLSVWIGYELILFTRQ
jgi:CrcB protein